MDIGLMVMQVIVALLLLTLGRQLFWLTVGLLGFAVTANIVTDALALQPDWLVLLVALVVGLLGALVAVFLQRLAAAIVGFLAGFYLVYSLLGVFGVDMAPAIIWVAAVITGTVGAVLAVAVYDWALIFLTSLAGASLLIEAVPLTQPMALVVFIVAVIVGVLVQARLMAARTAPPPYDYR